MKRGLSAESPSASRSLLIALLRPWSKSTKEFDGQSLLRSSSRVTTCPGFASSISRIRSGCSCSLILTPCLRSSPARTSNANMPKRIVCEAEEKSFIGVLANPLLALDELSTARPNSRCIAKESVHNPLIGDTNTRGYRKYRRESLGAFQNFRASATLSLTMNFRPKVGRHRRSCMNTILTPIKRAIILGCALLGMTQAVQTRVALSRHSGANAGRMQRFLAVRSLTGFLVAVLLASCGGGGGGGGGVGPGIPEISAGS